MVILAFPPHEYADQYGLLCVGGDLEAASLLHAYRNGIFPWPSDDSFLTWFSPPERGVLFFDNLHISRSLKKSIRQGRFSCSLNQKFNQVIQQCADSNHRIGQRGTWISPAMIRAYQHFHLLGYAHSVECYVDERLVGGIYGVSIGKFFAGESMFYLETNASKVALLYLIDHLSQQGVTFIDCQMVTELLASFGAIEVPRKQYLQLLRTVVSAPKLCFSPRAMEVLRLENLKGLGI